MFRLKDYQQRCLDELARYLRRTLEGRNAAVAFYEQTERAYRKVEALPGLPYVCIRVPTGGGKTVMAAHAVEIAAREFLRVDRCLVLWLAPTTQIVEQTLKALRDRRHPYRQALDTAFAGCVTVLDLASALSVQRSALDVDTVVIVSTLAAMRVENTEGRKIYEPNGQLMASFTGLSAEQRAALLDDGAPSLANLLRLRRPVVIVDEAHNARTPLSFDTLARLNPSCILEFTATPDEEPPSPSNVLTHVSAAELKAEEMIKLPIRLKTRANWKEAVNEAVAKQSELERLARQEEVAGSEYIRPIVLFQAQRNVQGQENVTFEALRQSLIADFNVPEQQIAISTGARNDLEGIDVLHPDQPIRYIITVDRLREGWDCPFAYILCSVSNLSSRTAVEQILGRVLRMPFAQHRKHDELNVAYAFVTSAGFVEAANNLREALVESGFERFEAQAFVRPETTGTLPDFGPLFTTSVSETVEAAPHIEQLPDDLRAKVAVQWEAGAVKLVYRGPGMTHQEKDALVDAVADERDKPAVERLCRKSRGEDASPSAMGEKFAVPVLAIRREGQMELFEEQFRDFDWNLAGRDPRLAEEEFSIRRTPDQTGEVDVTQEGRIAWRFVDDLERQLSFLDLYGPKTETELAVWLDRSILHPDLPQTQTAPFLRNLVQGCLDRGLFLEELIVHRFRLRDAAEGKIARYRRESERREFQTTLLPQNWDLFAVSPSLCFVYSARDYPAPRFYEGPHTFLKHFYERPADMNNEEADCAALIDSLQEVRYWVRNLVREGYAFRLPTSTDKFYPDFVALLTDGRYLAVEYKGEGFIDSDQTREKETVGAVWQAASGGTCVFRLVTRTDMAQKLSMAVRPHPEA